MIYSSPFRLRAAITHSSFLSVALTRRLREKMVSGKNSYGRLCLLRDKVMKSQLLNLVLKAVKMNGFLLTSLLTVFFVGCSQQEVNREDPDSLYNEAESIFKDERYLIAIEKYRDIKNRFPYSARAVDAELRIADTYFAQENYLEAESAYEIFKELHPTHPRSDYVQFRIGLAYYKEIPDNIARDLSAASRAIDAFSLLIEKYPKSEFDSQAKQYMAEARKKLGEHENYVADFYFQRKHYLSASYRYASLLRDFPKMGYDEEALYRLGQCYYHIRMYSNASEALKRLLANYPNSNFKAESESLLEELKKKN
ncbi:MAG: outer membrane protein assembly factor BamD [Deltaproteobacteria bacterium]|nr:outer membrane protein assembly factor BamD [Deltaproteobacteria bacterium]